jgi:hypothetical protein
MRGRLKSWGSLQRRIDFKPAHAPFPPHLCGEESREGRGGGHCRPDQGVRGGEVVEQPGGLVGVGGADGHVEDATCGREGG